MFRLLMLLAVAGVAAYFTNPAQEVHAEHARVVIEGGHSGESQGGNMLEEMAGLIKGMMAGEGRYENFYVLSRFTVDTPGSDFVECYGAYTLVRCQLVEPGGEG